MVKIKDGVVTDPALKWLYQFWPCNYESPKVISPTSKKNFGLLRLDSNHKLLQRVLELKNRFKIPKGDSTMNEYEVWAKKLFNDKNTKQAFDEQLNLLLKDFHASNRWKKTFGYFLIFNRASDSVFPSAFDYYINQERTSVIVEINRNTTLNDIKKGWKAIERQKTALKTLGGIVKNERIKGDFLVLNPGNVYKSELIKPRKNYFKESYRIGKKAYDMRYNGKSNKEISEVLKIDLYHVSHYIKQYKDYLNSIELY